MPLVTSRFICSHAMKREESVKHDDAAGPDAVPQVFERPVDTLQRESPSDHLVKFQLTGGVQRHQVNEIDFRVGGAVQASLDGALLHDQPAVKSELGIRGRDSHANASATPMDASVCLAERVGVPDGLKCEVDALSTGQLPDHPGPVFGGSVNRVGRSQLHRQVQTFLPEV